MILREDKYSEKVSPYLRPNIPYVCGRAASWGTPCHRGPNNDGSCGGISECQPFNDKGRWTCRRPAGAGGPCQEGPMPDGSCCKSHPPCQPTKTLRKIRGRFSLLAATLVIASIAAFGFSSNNNNQMISVLDAGPLSSNHQQFTKEGNCSSCHEAHGSDAMGWLNAILSPANLTKNCINCHQFEQPINGPHNSNVIATNHPENTSCTMCHTEHKGINANITQIGDDQCSSCHKQKIDHFAGNHPKFSNNYPFKKRTAIAFNHLSHLETHFKDARFVKNAPKNGCVDCHDISKASRAVPIKGFQTNCSGCHQDTISDRPLTVFTFPELEENPFNVAEIIKSQGLLSSDREEALESIQALTDKLTNSSDRELAVNAAQLRVTAEQGVVAGKKAAIRVLVNSMINNITLLSNSKIDPPIKSILRQLKEPAQELVSNTKMAKTLFSEEVKENMEESIEALSEGMEELEEILKDNRQKPMVKDIRSIMAALNQRIEDIEPEEDYEPVSSESLDPVSAALMGVDGEDVEEYGESVETLISGILEEGVHALSDVIKEAGGNPDLLLHGLSNETLIRPAVAWASNREYEATVESNEKGWYATELSLNYNAVSHSDPVIKSWLEFAAKSGNPLLTETLLSRTDGAGACTKCHAVSSAKASNNNSDKSSIKIEWISNQTQTNPYVHYSHGPHVNLLGPGTWCSSCHQLDTKADSETTFNQLDPSKFSSNFLGVEKGVCVECHGGGQVAETCLTCHKYHQTPRLAKTMLGALVRD